GTSAAKRSNQKKEIWVSTSPFRGMPLGMMQSKAEMRSLATSSKRSPKSNISRTLPLFTLRMPGKSSSSNGSFMWEIMDARLANFKSEIFNYLPRVHPREETPAQIEHGPPEIVPCSAKTTTVKFRGRLW